MMKQRDLALKKATKTKLDTDILIYKGLRNKVVNELRSAKSSFYIHALNEAKGNGKNIWKHISNLIGREGHHTENVQLKSQGKLIKDNRSIASIFNLFFIESVSKLSNHFKNDNFTPVFPLHPEADQGFNLKVTNEAHIKKIVGSLKTSKSKDALYS